MKKLTVLFVALVMVFAALPAFAQDKADWAFYGSARMWTSWESADEETLFGGSGGSRARGWDPGFGLGLQDDGDLDWKFQTNSRFGANVKWGNVGGTVEFGNNGAPTGGDFGATWRLLYGTWNFGPGTLVVGKDYTPYFFLVSGLCGPGGGECNGIGWGSIYGGRRAQLKLKMGGFQVALIEPVSTVRPMNSASPVLADFNPAGDIDQTMPKIEASYTFSLGPAALYIGGFYNSYDQEFGTIDGVKEVSNESWALAAGVKTAFGPLYVNSTAQYGRNVAQAGMPTNLLAARMVVDGTTLGEEDADYMAAQLVLGFKVMDTLSFEGGAVWQRGEADVPGASISIDQDTWVYYIQAVWSPAKNVFIIPELGLINNGDLEVTGDPDTDLGKITWFGVKWQINF